MSNPRSPLRKRSKGQRKFRIAKITIYPRGKVWWLYWREAGETRRIPVGSDRKEAEKRAAEINVQLVHELPTTFGFERVNTSELRRLWLEHHELVLRSSSATIRRYRAATEHLARFIKEKHPGMPADCLSQRTAESFVKWLRRTKVAPNGHTKAIKRHLLDKGVIFILSTCRSLFNYASRHRHLPPYAPNPFAELGIERMKVEDAKPNSILAPAEEAAFLEACDLWQFRVFFTLAFTGMRPGELCHLLVEDVDREAGLLHIRNRPELGWKTKSRKERRIHLFDELLAVVNDAIGKRTCGSLFLARQFDSGQKVPVLANMESRALSIELRARVAETIKNNEGDPRYVEEEKARQLWKEMGALTPKQVRREYIKVAGKIGRPDLTCPNLWRHQMATAMQEANVDPFARKEIIGHTRLETTALYTHTRGATLKREMVKVAELRKTALSVVKKHLG